MNDKPFFMVPTRMADALDEIKSAEYRQRLRELADFLCRNVDCATGKGSSSKHALQKKYDASMSRIEERLKKLATMGLITYEKAGPFGFAYSITNWPTSRARLEKRGTGAGPRTGPLSSSEEGRRHGVSGDEPTESGTKSGTPYSFIGNSITTPPTPSQGDEPEVKLFAYWNSKGKVIKHREVEKHRRSIKAVLNIYSLDELKTAVDNYALVLNGDDYFWTHRWGLQEFLQRGIDKFLPGNFDAKDYLRDKGNGDRRQYGRRGGREEDPLDPAAEKALADLNARWAQR